MRLKNKIFGLLLVFGCFFPAYFQANAFSDIEESPYEEAITYAQEENIVQGYPDGSFRPDDFVNRAEFTKIIIEAKIEEVPEQPTENCFSDILKSQWFASYVCYAKAENILSGYPDGTFEPAQNITVVEAAKVVANVFELPVENFKGGAWYMPALSVLEDNNYLPTSFSGLEDQVTRAEMVEMIWRIKEEKHNQQTVSVEELINPTCLRFTEDPITNVDMDEVRRVWLSWMNAERAALGLHPYTYNEQLNRTAFLWSQFSAERDQGSHKRIGQTAYYDYNIITRWFRDLGLTFANVYRVTYSENIGWWPYRCSEADCTQKMIATIRNTFDGYMREKGKASSAHYDSMTNKYFNEIGMGIALSASGKSYITTHYATEITSDPLPICK